MLKIIRALIAGLIVGMAANMILVTLNLKLFPASTPLNNPEAWNDYIVSLPDTAFIIPVLAHLSQAFFGAWVTARLSPTQPFKFAMAIGVLSLLGGILNASSLPIPIWMWLEMPFYLILAGVAGKIELNRRDISLRWTQPCTESSFTRFRQTRPQKTSRPFSKDSDFHR